MTHRYLLWAQNPNPTAGTGVRLMAPPMAVADGLFKPAGLQRLSGVGFSHCWVERVDRVCGTSTSAVFGG